MNTLSKSTSSVFATGLAVFSMFCGAGSITFPLIVGRAAGGTNFYAAIGLFITALIIPCLGLLAVILFDGDYCKFFRRIGKVPGMAFVCLIMILLGPLAVIPRTITLSFSVFDYSGFNTLPFWGFNALSCALIFVCAFYRSRIIGVFGYFLSPLLVLFLGFIIFNGLFGAPVSEGGADIPLDGFMIGLEGGYNTLDLLGAFCFSGMVIAGLQGSASTNPRSILKKALLASLIAIGALGVLYISLSFVSAYHRASLDDLQGDQLLVALSFLLLGKHAGLIVCLTTALTCLTTAISLAVIFADFIQKEILREKVSYQWCLLVTVVLCFTTSFLGFDGISQIVIPLAFLCYPTFIVLSVMNIVHKIWNVRLVKIPVYATLTATILVKLLA